MPDLVEVGLHAEHRRTGGEYTIVLQAVDRTIHRPGAQVLLPNVVLVSLLFRVGNVQLCHVGVPHSFSLSLWKYFASSSYSTAILESKVCLLADPP
jgi:hypothetical protein